MKFGAKTSLLKEALVIIFILTASGCRAADNTPPQITSNMTSSQIAALLQDNRNNAEGIFRVILNALAQRQIVTVYNTLNSLAKKEPDNPIILESFCLTWNAAQMMFPPDLIDASRSLDLPDNPEEAANSLYQIRLNHAYQLDRKPWIGLITDGLRQACIEHHYDSGIRALKRAVRVSPEISYTHYALAYALCMNSKDSTDYSTAKTEAEAAYKLHPFFWSDAMLLFEINAGWLPNHTEALKWKQVVLSLTPDPSKLDPATRHALESYK